MKGIDNTHLFNANMIATADLDKEVVVSYAAIHCGLTNEMIENYEDYPSKEEMVRQLTDKRLGYDFKKDVPYDWEKLSRKKDKTKGIEKYWLADHISHNLGDMMQIESLPYSDLLTYSTPCTDLSIAGKQEGLKWTCHDCGCEYDPSELDVDTRYTCPNCGSHNIKSTRSGLLYEVERLLVKAKENNTLPKYLLMENVDALVSKKYIDSFKDWLIRLDNLGYNSYYQTINAKNTGIPQNRNRIFCISIRKDIDTKSFEFPQPFDTGIRLKDLLETDSSVLEKYFLSDEVQKRLQITDPKFEKNVVGTTIGQNCTRLGNRDLVYQQDSVMGANFSIDGDEITFVKRLLTELYPNTSFSMVSDTYDYWNMVNNILPQCKEEIMNHNGKLLVRPDSGDIVEISVKTVERLWEIFGGSVNGKGYKVLNPHIGIIYGDGCTLSNVETIWKELEKRGFAANNIAYGVGAFCFTAIVENGKMIVVTRDTFGIAMKATYGVIDGKKLMIFKDPKTDTSHLKKSHKGCCRVYDDNGELKCQDQLLEMSDNSLLTTVFKDGELVREDTFADIRNRMYGGE